MYLQQLYYHCLAKIVLLAGQLAKTPAYKNKDATKADVLRHAIHHLELALEIEEAPPEKPKLTVVK